MVRVWYEDFFDYNYRLIIIDIKVGFRVLFNCVLFCFWWVSFFFWKSVLGFTDSVSVGLSFL